MTRIESVVARLSPVTFATAEQAVLATVAYADVFDMPTPLAQVHPLLIGYRCDSSRVLLAVAKLSEQGKLDMVDDLMFLPGRQHVVENWAVRRDHAQTAWPTAVQWARRIGRLPFVRMVAVSGSLAVDASTDPTRVSLLVVTRPRRMWVARRMIMSMRDRALASGIHLDINIVLTTASLELSDRSTYAARELAQMQVIVNGPLADTLRRSNDWALDYVPNLERHAGHEHLSDDAPTKLQKFIEGVVLTAPFALLEWLLRRQATSQPSIRAASSRHQCRSHEQGNAEIIEASWQRRIPFRWPVPSWTS